MDKVDYANAMAILEAGCHQNGVASINFSDSEVLMISLEKLRELLASAEAKGQDRVMIFIQRGTTVDEGVKA